MCFLCNNDNYCVTCGDTLLYSSIFILESWDVKLSKSQGQDFDLIEVSMQENIDFYGGDAVPEDWWKLGLKIELNLRNQIATAKGSTKQFTFKLD